MPGAWADCSRALQVPMAELGVGVMFEGDRLAGVYPSLLKELGPAAGCEFVTSQVPRARQQRLLETGQADILIPAARSPGRDAHGEFVPLLQIRPGLMGFDRERPPLRSLAQLLAAPELRLAAVRGFSYGTPYEDAVAQLRAQQRLVEEADVAGVVKALRKGLAHVTIMAPYVMEGTLSRDPKLAPLVKDLRVELLDELPWGETGAYLSRHSLKEVDREQLRQCFGKAGRSGRVHQLFMEHSSWSGLADTVRPLPESR